MAAKLYCKKGYNTKDGYIEFKKIDDSEYCPVSNEDCCEQCQIKHRLDKEK